MKKETKKSGSSKKKPKKFTLKTTVKKAKVIERLEKADTVMLETKFPSNFPAIQPTISPTFTFDIQKGIGKEYLIEKLKIPEEMIQIIKY